jgi:CubicO group peptidase (beta-lactamase class C family)
VGTGIRCAAALAAWACALGLPAAIAQPAAEEARLAAVANAYAPAFLGSVLVADGDAVLLDKGYGKANLEWDQDNAPDVKFRVGSLTKQFTATLVLLLQQEGKLDITQPVTRYLPDAPAAWGKVTLAELLGQTSGIPDFTADKGFSEWSMSPRTPAEILAFFKDRPLEFDPGSKFEYSNSNYQVLGAVIEKVAGKPYGELLRERIFRPLGMTDTGLDADELILAHRAQGYRRRKGVLEQPRSESMTVPWAAGAIYSTTGDLLKWERGLFGGKLLDAASVKAMTTAGKGDYGLGVLVVQRGGSAIIWHNGGIEGFHAFLAYAPQKRVTVAVLSNVDSGLPDVTGAQLLDVALGRPVFIAGEQTSAPISEADLAKFEGAFQLKPGVTLVFSRVGDQLMLKAGERPVALLYEGLRNGRPTFNAPSLYLEVEFTPDANGAVTSAILHQGLEDAVVTRQ